MMALHGLRAARSPTGRANRRPGDEHVSLRDALLIGCAQALAIVPGTSRSGATIAAALFLGHRREEAARFSFLLALPDHLRRGARKVPQLLPRRRRHGPVLVGHGWRPRVSGFLAIRFLLAYVRTRTYRPFVLLPLRLRGPGLGPCVLGARGVLR